VIGSAISPGGGSKQIADSARKLTAVRGGTYGRRLSRSGVPVSHRSFGVVRSSTPLGSIRKWPARPLASWSDRLLLRRAFRRPQAWPAAGSGGG
jgi:hypothetical protein